MNDRTMRTAGSVAVTLGLAVLCFILLLTALHGVGTDAGLYYAEQTKAGVLPAAGISDADLQTLDGALANYLAGRPNDLLLPLDSAPGEYSVLALRVDGELRPAFNEKEMTHLADCFDLFALLRKVRRRLIPWAVLLIVGGAYLLRDRRRIRRCAALSPLILLIPLGAFAAWAIADFEGAFTFFHRVLFRNDLWLLDPRTDLLIRICPQSMFEDMGRRIALRGLAILAGVPALAAGLTLVWPKPKKSEDDTWNNRDMRRASGAKRMTFGNGAKR